MDIFTISLVVLIAGIVISLAAVYFTSRQPRSRTTLLLWVVGLGLLAINLWLTLTPPPPTVTIVPNPNPIPLNAESIARGNVLYETHCLRCHGDNLDGTGPDAADLAVPPANLHEHFPSHDDMYHFTVITNGVGAMPPLGAVVPEQDRWYIINYLRDATKGDATNGHDMGDMEGMEHGEH